MKVVMKIFPILFLGLLCFVSFAEAADVAKIGVVDFQKILQNSSAGKYAQAEINKKGKQMESELAKKGAGIEERKKQIEKESLVMSKEMREEKQREIRIQINDLKVMQKRYTREFKAFENRLVQRIRKDVLKIVDEIGKTEGYLMIVERKTGEVIYSPTSADITDAFIQNYNKTFSVKTPGKK
ncbi:MAG: OmpH family outer membrane protein [Deltaproteobacteria bacterium]|nr:OmpH family outer membrane protein [Deltaproteobacteria bacterium]